MDGRRKTKKLPLNVESPSPPLSKYCLLVPNALLKCGGQPIIQVGLLWILHSIKAGLWATCAVWQCFCLLNGASWNSFALWGSFWLGCEHTFFCNFLLLRAYASSPLQDAFIYNMFSCGKLCTLVLWLCGFTFYFFNGWWYQDTKAAYWAGK